jgi:integrase
MRLTQTKVAMLTLPEGKAEAIIFDDDLPGFGLRIRSSGARTWVYQYKLGTQNRRITIGNAAALTVTVARESAVKLHAKVRLGQDPAAEKIEGRSRAAETVGAVAQNYLAARREHLRPKSYAEVERHLLTYAKPLLGLPLTGINRRAIAARLSIIAAQSGDVTANRARSSWSAFFAWCMREGLLDNNPVLGTNVRPEQSRTRVLSDEELKVIWNATAGGDDYSAIIRLLMLSGCRAAEIGGLAYAEIRDDRIELPPERVKNRHPHVIPITAPMRTILDARPRREGLVFGGRNGRPFNSWGAEKLALDARIGATGVKLEQWTPHDIRRSVATHMAESGIALPHIIEAILNHVSGHKGGVAGIYNRANYEPQKRAVLEKWGNHIETLIGGKRSAEIIRLGA